MNQPSVATVAFFYPILAHKYFSLSRRVFLCKEHNWTLLTKSELHTNIWIECFNCIRSSIPIFTWSYIFVQLFFQLLNAHLSNKESNLQQLTIKKFTSEDLQFTQLKILYLLTFKSVEVYSLAFIVFIDF